MTDTKHETQQNASHTPGPWRYEVTAEGYDIKAGRYGVLVAYTGTNHIDEANARLIAAAPDLLNVLTVLANHCDRAGIPVNAARAAIAKATGGAA